MSVQTVDYSMKVPKEGKEIADAATAIVHHFIMGKSIAEAAALLPAIMTAVDGAGNVMADIKSEYKDELAAYFVHKLWESLEKDPQPEVTSS